MQADPGGGARLFSGDTVLSQDAAGVVSGVRTYSSNGVHIAEVSATAGASGSTLTWLFSDVDGTVDTQTVATTGATTSQYRDPFGNGVGASSGVWADGNGFLNKPASTDTGLTSLGDRFYDATLGRFVSADPVLAVGNPQQVNGYSYAANDPITNTDPSGDCYETGAVSDYLTHTTNCANGAHGANAAGAVTAPGASPVHGSSGGSRVGRAPAAASGAHATSNAPSWLAGGKQAALDAGRGMPINWAAVGIGAGIGVLALLGIACVIATVGVCAFADVGVGAGVGAGVAEGAEVAATAAEVASAGDTAAGAGASESEIGDLVATCGGESFTPDTAVRLASGGAVAISALKVGDRVLATNPSTGKAEPKTVQRVWVNHDTDLMDLTVKTAGSTAVIHTTQHHPIWDASKRSFVDADQLRVGDQLDSHSGATVTVLSTQVVAGSADMWDLTVDSDHDFYVATVTDVLVHNCPIEPRDVHGELNAASREIDVNHVIDNGDLYLNMGKEQSIRVLDRGDGTGDAVIRDLNGMNRITAFNAKNGYVENRVATGEWQ